MAGDLALALPIPYLAALLFQHGLRSLGAVQLNDPRQVWLPKGPLAPPLAAPAAALLVLRELSPWP